MLSSWPQLLVQILLAGRPGSCVRMGHAFWGCAGDLPGNIVGVFFAGAHRAHCFFLPDNVDCDTFCFIKVIVDGEQPSQGGQQLLSQPAVFSGGCLRCSVHAHIVA